MLSTLLVLLLLVAGYGTWMWVAAGHVWDARGTVDAMPSGNRPAAGAGKNFVIVGADGRSADGGTTGRNVETGARTDTIMVMHVPDNGSPTLVSLPRDSYVDLPAIGQYPAGKNKINASYAWGGPRALVQTVEGATGLRIDGYMEIGFSGFQQVIDSVGGLDVCLDRDLGLNQKYKWVTKGCHHMDGEMALAYVRMRKNDPLGDIGRAQRQRQVIGLLMKKVATPGTLLLPWRLEAVGKPMASMVVMDQGMSRKDTLDLFLALRDLSGGKGTSTVVPMANMNLSTPAGSAVQWDAEKAPLLFDALRNDREIPTDALMKLPGQK